MSPMVISAYFAYRVISSDAVAEAESTVERPESVYQPINTFSDNDGLGNTSEIISPSLTVMLPTQVPPFASSVIVYVPSDDVPVAALACAGSCICGTNDTSITKIKAHANILLTVFFIVFYPFLLTCGDENARSARDGENCPRRISRYTVCSKAFGGLTDLRPSENARPVFTTAEFRENSYARFLLCVKRNSGVCLHTEYCVISVGIAAAPTRHTGDVRIAGNNFHNFSILAILLIS